MARVCIAEKEWDPQAFAHGVSEIPVSQCMTMSALFNNDSAVRSSYETLCRALLSGGISISKKNFALRADMMDRMHASWLTMCRVIIQQLVTFGIMFMHMEGDTPVHIDICLLCVRVRRDQNGVVHYNARYRNNFVKVPTLLVFERSPPDIQGNLTSALRSVLQPATFVNLMLACSAKAEQRKASPPIFTETTSNTMRVNQVHRDYAETGDMRSMNSEALATSGAEYEDVTRRVETFISDLNAERFRAREAINSTQAKWVFIDPTTGVPNYPVEGEDTNFAALRYPLPENQKLVTNLPSSSPSFLVEYTELYHEEIAKIFGVPPGLFGSARSAVAVNQTILNTFSWALQDYRILLQTVITSSLNHFYGKENAAHAMAHAAPGATTSQNYRDHTFSVSLPGTLDPEIINMLSDRGFIAYPVVRRYISQYYGIPQEDISSVRLDGVTGRPLSETLADAEGSSSDVAAEQRTSRPQSVMPPKKKRKTPYPNQRERE